MVSTLIINQIRKFGRWIYTYPMKQKIKNKNFTFITNNCIAGLVYHDLGLKFYSPTINLFITAIDYIKFISDLESYLAMELKELIDNKDSYPIGLLGEGAKEIKIHFLHYSSFTNASTQWNKRKARVNFDNLFILAEYLEEEGWDAELLERFKGLAYKNKAVLIPSNVKNPISQIYKFCYLINDQNLASWVKNNWKIWKKGYDEFPFIQWLNKLS